MVSLFCEFFVFFVLTFVGCTLVTIHTIKKVRVAAKAIRLAKELEPQNAMLEKYHVAAMKAMDKGDMVAMREALEYHRLVKLRIYKILAKNGQ